MRSLNPAHFALLLFMSCAGQEHTPPQPVQDQVVSPEADPDAPAAPTREASAGGSWSPPTATPPSIDWSLGMRQSWTDSPPLGLVASGLPDVILRSMQAELMDPLTGASLGALKPWTFEGHRYEWHDTVNGPVDLGWRLSEQQVVATTHRGLRIHPDRPLDLGQVDLGEHLDAWIFDLTHSDPDAQLTFNLKAVDEDGNMVGTGLPLGQQAFIVLAPPPVARLELRVGSMSGAGGNPRILDHPPGRHVLDLSQL